MTEDRGGANGVRVARAARWLLPLAALLSGCPSISLLSSARTIPAGESQWVVGAIAQSSVVVPEGTRTLIPFGEFAWRRGITDTTDIELRYNLSSLTVSPRYQLRRHPDGEAGVDVMILAVGGVTGMGRSDLKEPGPVGGGHAALVLPIGFATAAGDQLVVAPRLSAGGSGYGRAWMAGGSIAWVHRFASQSGAAIIPECAVAAGHVDRGLRFRGPVFQCTVGFAGALIQVR
jgi:hypothetical protein